jgi:hypothetical protein
MKFLLKWTGIEMRLNLTQHVATPEQGCVEPADKQRVQHLLTFGNIPDVAIVRQRAADLAALAKDEGAVEAMIGGAPYLMGPLEEELAKCEIQAVYAFSIRRSIEVVDNGFTVKKTVFKHAGFVPAAVGPEYGHNCAQCGAADTAATADTDTKQSPKALEAANVAAEGAR